MPGPLNLNHSSAEILVGRLLYPYHLKLLSTLSHQSSLKDTQVDGQAIGRRRGFNLVLRLCPESPTRGIDQSFWRCLPIRSYWKFQYLLKGVLGDLHFKSSRTKATLQAFRVEMSMQQGLTK